MQVYLNIVQIIISIALIAAVLLQARHGGMGEGVFGGMSGTIHQTRRGLERTLFNITIGLSIAFFVITFINVIVTG
jgi:preprotein translocase subunit SecG